ncbi:unnamed protein product [Brassica oleracea var. botrytis]
MHSRDGEVMTNNRSRQVSSPGKYSITLLFFFSLILKSHQKQVIKLTVLIPVFKR